MSIYVRIVGRYVEKKNRGINQVKYFFYTGRQLYYNEIKENSMLLFFSYGWFEARLCWLLNTHISIRVPRYVLCIGRACWRRKNLT